MEFTLSGPDIVRSDHQRWLLNHWAGHRQLATLPIWHGLDVIEVAVPFDDLSYTEVGKENGNMRFRIAFHGARIAQAYGRSNCIGKFLDEILPPGYSNVALSTYRQTVEGKLPDYTLSDMREPA